MRIALIARTESPLRLFLSDHALSLSCFLSLSSHTIRITTHTHAGALHPPLLINKLVLEPNKLPQVGLLGSQAMLPYPQRSSHH